MRTRSNGMSAKPDIRRFTYRQGMLDKVADAESLPATVLQGDSLSLDVVDSLFENDLLSLDGEYGIPDAGEPIQYDHLVVETDQKTVDIKVYNRAIMLFCSDDDIYKRIHRVCC